MNLTFNGWVSIAVVVAVFVTILRRRGAPIDLLFLLGLVAVTLFGVVTPQQALSGFSNPAVLIIGALFVAAAGLRNTGVVDWIGHKLLGSSKTETSALRRIAVAMLPSSAFIANTPLVAMMLPVVVDWCRRREISPSRLLIPLSYLVILGGICTLIGTSTTLVVNGMLKAEYQLEEQRVKADEAAILQDPSQKTAKYDQNFHHELRGMGLFEIGKVGLPCAIVGAIVLLFIAKYVLPNRKELVDQFGQSRREYLVEMMVQPECRLIGQNVEQAGLRHLPGLFLIEISRTDSVITPVSPSDVIQSGDRLVFTGVISTIVDLEKIPGLVPAVDTEYDLDPQSRQQRHLTEAVLSRTSPLIGTTLKDANFRQRYGAAVVAVHRNGVRLSTKIGSIELEPGDTLLLQTLTDFVDTFRNNSDFYLVGTVDGSSPVRHDRAWISSTLMVILIVWLSITGLIQSDSAAFLSSPAIAAITIASLMVLTRCLSVSMARSALDLQVLITIAAALGLGRALTESGAAQELALGMVKIVGDNPYILLLVLYLLTMIFTEMITNNAVAAMFFPLAVALAWHGGVDFYNPRPFIMAVTLAASVSFITPIGYQTNLMVMGPGGYRPGDYFRSGWILSLVVMITALFLIPLIWPFQL